GCSRPLSYRAVTGAPERSRTSASSLRRAGARSAGGSMRLEPPAGIEPASAAFAAPPPSQRRGHGAADAERTRITNLKERPPSQKRTGANWWVPQESNLLAPACRAGDHPLIMAPVLGEGLEPPNGGV